MTNDYEITDLKSYIEIIKQTIIEAKTYKDTIWFRGQSNSDWDLGPSIFRGKALDIDNNEDINPLSYKWNEDFDKNFSDVKNELYKDNFLPSGSSEFEAMFIAQHRSLHTPLLDWTTEPLVALFFALDGAKADTSASIYMLRPGLLNSNSQLFQGKNKNITTPLDVSNKSLDMWSNHVCSNSQDNPFNIIPFAAYTSSDIEFRIARQAGKFTIHGPLTLPSHFWYNTEVAYTDVNNKVIDNHHYKFADKYIIPTSSFDSLRDALKILGITRESIYGEDNSIDMHISGIYHQDK